MMKSQSLKFLVEMSEPNSPFLLKPPNLASRAKLHKLNVYSCPCLVVDYTEELISRTFLGEIQFRLVSQDRVRSQNRSLFV